MKLLNLFKKKEDEKNEIITEFKIDLNPQIIDIPEFQDKTKIDLKYPLLPPYTYAHIYWDHENSELVYSVEEPMLSDAEKEILKKLETGIKELINISLVGINSVEAIIGYLEKNVNVLLNELGIKISKESLIKIMYYIYRDFVGMNEIESLLKDYYIEDIECNGAKFPIYIVHRKFRNIRTNISFEDNNKLRGFVEKLAQKCGKYVSYANPLLDGVLPDGSVDYNERFIYKKDGKIIVSEIGRFIDKYYSYNESNIPKHVKNIQVPAFDSNLKIKWRKIDYVYRHRINEKLYELNLEAGRKVKLTGAHSVFILRKNGIKPEKVSNIKEGDYVVVPKFLPTNNNIIKEINLAKELSKTKLYKKIVIEGIPSALFKSKEKEIRDYYKKNYKLVNQTYYEHKNKNILPIKLYYLLDENILRRCKLKTTSPVKIPTFLKVNRELMRLLGYYIAEGWLSKTGNHHRIYFCLNKNEKKYIKEINSYFNKCFTNKVYLEPIYKNGRKLCLNSLLTWATFKYVLKTKKYARKKVIPEIVFNVKTELQKEFIETWHNGDFGSTSSRKLANDISYLGLFNEQIVPFYHKLKSSIIEDRKIISQEFYTNFFRRKASDFHTMIPIELFNPLNNVHNSLINKRIRRDRLKTILDDIRFKRFKNLDIVNSKKFIVEWNKRGFIEIINEKPYLTKSGQEIVNELDLVRNLIDSDLAFLKINKINKVKSRSEFVYDVSVPNYENFVAGSGGICCHNSRVNATYSEDISSRGPTFSIRKFTREPWTPIKLIEFRTASPEILAYIWILIENQSNIMVIGGTGSGKTTLLNALAFFIQPSARIVSIEDTREIQLMHKNWLPSVARMGFGLSNILGQKHGEVSLFDLLKESFRQRPDYVIVGEIRGEEAFVLFQGASSGHPTMSTMHAESVESMVRRLETEPINLSPALIESLDVVIIIGEVKKEGSSARKIYEIDEILKVGQDSIGKNRSFFRDPIKDKFYFDPNNKMFDKISKEKGIPVQNLKNEFRRRTLLLLKMYQNHMFGFKEVSEVINLYYKDPKYILKKFGIE